MKPVKTGFFSFRIGLAKYILPLVFVYDPRMLFIGDPLSIFWGIFKGFAGIFILTITTEGYLYAPVGFVGRILAGLSAALIFHPSFMTDVSGIGLALLLVGFYRFLRDRTGKEVAI